MKKPPVKLKTYTFYTEKGVSFSRASKNCHNALEFGHQYGDPRNVNLTESIDPVLYFKDGIWKEKDDTIFIDLENYVFDDVWKELLELLESSKRVIVQAPGTYQNKKHCFIFRKTRLESSTIISAHFCRDVKNLISLTISETPLVFVVESLDLLKEYVRFKLESTIPTIIEQPFMFIIG